MLAVIAVGALILAGVVTSRYVDTNLRTAITVNGVAISRGDLRARLTLEQALLDARLAHVRTGVAAGSVSATQQAALATSINAGGDDPLSAAIDGLVDDQLIVSAAAREGLRPSVDADAELARAAAGDITVELRWLTIDDSDQPGQPGAGVPVPAGRTASTTARTAAEAAAAAWAGQAAKAGTGLEAIKASLAQAGWTVATEETWLPASGPVAGLPDGLVGAARDGNRPVGSWLGPFVDPIHGTGAIALLERRGQPTDPGAAQIVADARVDGGALTRWATARAAERALAARLLDRWRTEPQLQVRASELVIGPAAVEGRSGSFVSLAQLVVDQLPADPSGSPADAATLASDLRSRTEGDREDRFRTLITEANQRPSDDPLRHSGELGFFTTDELVADLATAAFAPGVADGSVLGPIATSAGPQLYLVRASFTGSLDERSDAALVEARGTTDLVGLAEQISPAGDIARAGSGPFRTEAELAGSTAAHAGFLQTPAQALSDPFVVDDQLVVIRPIERKTAVADPAALERLTVRGWAAWLAGQRAGATVVVDPEPLPGVTGPSPSASASPTSPGIETPFLPAIPGSSVGEPTQSGGLPSFPNAP